MKQKLIVLFLTSCVGLAIADSIITKDLTPNSAHIAATTTNATAGDIIEIWNPVSTARIYLTGTGIAATTNGTLTVKLLTASGRDGVTNGFDAVVYAPYAIRLTSDLGANTHTVSTNVNLSGVRYIRVGQTENTFLGTVSNMAIRISAPSGGGTRP